ncbi:MAG: chemotaxis protein CheX [Lysobacter sp.]
MAAKFLGQVLLEQGLINKDQLLAALEIQRASNPMLGELAQAHGMLDAAQAQMINTRQRSEDKRFGDIAQSLGLLSAAQVDELLAQQKSQRKLFGEILVEQNMLSREQVEQALQAQQAERDDAVQALELGVAGHPMGDVIGVAISTSSKLFTRTLKSRCQFSSLVQSPADLASCTVTGYVRVDADRPLLIGLACDQATMTNIASAFIGIAASKCDDELARDALGELINVLMGYVVKDTLPDDARYRASPPKFGVGINALMASSQQSLAVSMASELGPFVLMVGR